MIYEDDNDDGDDNNEDDGVDDNNVFLMFKSRYDDKYINVTKKKRR